MQKWEYIEVTAPMREDGKFVHIYRNGSEALPETMASSLYDYLNKLGNEGGNWLISLFIQIERRSTTSSARLSNGFAK